EAIDADLEIDANLRNEIGRSQHRSRYLVEAGGKISDLVARNGDAGRSTVSAVAQQMFARLAERTMQVEFGNRSSGPLPLLARQRDQHRRAAEFLDESRSD